MRTINITLSNKVPESGDLDIFFKGGEKHYRVACTQKINFPLSLTLKNAAGRSDTLPFYTEELNKTFEKKYFHTHMKIEKGRNDLPNSIILHVSIF